MYRIFASSSFFFLQAVGCMVAMLAGSAAIAQQPANECGQLRSPGQYGPYDFRTGGDYLPRVLTTHFTPVMEALIRESGQAPPATDIDYTLRAIPNMHRALLAMMKAGDREKTDKPNGSRYTVECWLKRAVLFSPDDSLVRMIYSTYLNGKGRVPEANAQLDLASHHARDNGFTHFNVGLHYFELKNYDKALAEAHKAISLEWPDTMLRDQLKAVGKWSEPADPAVTSADGNSSQTADK